MLDIATTHYALKSGIGTKANESVSGRAHRMGWRHIERVIDAVFSPFERDHCRKAHEVDVARAMKLLQLED